MYLNRIFWPSFAYKHKKIFKHMYCEQSIILCQTQVDHDKSFSSCLLPWEWCCDEHIKRIFFVCNSWWRFFYQVNVLIAMFRSTFKTILFEYGSYASVFLTCQRVNSDLVMDFQNDLIWLRSYASVFLSCQRVDSDVVIEIPNILNTLRQYNRFVVKFQRWVYPGLFLRN